MVERRRFAYWDMAGGWHDTVQTWVKLPATDAWFVVAVEELPVDAATAPVQPTRPV